MKILIVSKSPTHPINAGNRWGVLAQCNVLRELGAEVHFLYVEERALSSKRRAEYDSILNEMRNYWGESLHVYHVSKLIKIGFVIKKTIYGLLQMRPRCDSYFPNGLIRFVNQLNKEYNFTVCIVQYFYLTKLLTRISIPQKALMTHDNYTYKDLRLSCRPKDCDHTVDANQMAKAIQRSPHVFSVQDDERIFFAQLSPRSVHYTIYSGYDFHDQAIVGNRNILFFSGGNQFNINGIKWFINYVFPLIRKKYEDATLIIGGSICDALHQFSDIEGVNTVGFVKDPAEFYKLGDIAINPVYQGTGLKIKTFESLSYGKVTIVHPHSLEGIFQKDAAPLLSSDDPNEWVDFIDKIWTDQLFISDMKGRIHNYFERLNSHIDSEYKRFLMY